MQKKCSAILWISLCCISLWGQKPTVGLTYISPHVTEVYTLFSPAASKSVFLINNCGEKVHEWNTDYMPGQGVKLKDNGDLVRTGKINNDNFSGGGGLGGRVEILDWDGKVKWGYNYSSSAHSTHHDMCVLPNGNILLMAWEAKSVQDALAAGRNPAYMPYKGLWTEQLIELKPVGVDSAVIVWKWDVWDHLVQDYDSTKANYGVVANHPEMINLNYDKTDNTCWVHFNALDYNAELNQIIVSSRVFGEIWIIDHDTATEGNSKSNLLFRYGNPEAFDRGTAADLKLFYQHDTRWVPCGTKYDDAIMVFNNGTNRPDGEYSTIETWLPEKNNDGSYLLQANNTFKVKSLWTYNQNNKHAGFFSRRVSSADLLPNGHMRICSGTDGRFLEIDENENIVWQYICPISLGGEPVSQGERTPFVINSVFKTQILFPNHPALANKTLLPKGTVEKNAYARICDPHINATHIFSVEHEKESCAIVINIPAYHDSYTLKAINMQSYSTATFTITGNLQAIDISKFNAGAYIFVLTDSEGYSTRNHFIKMPD